MGRNKVGARVDILYEARIMVRVTVPIIDRVTGTWAGYMGGGYMICA